MKIPKENIRCKVRKKTKHDRKYCIDFPLYLNTIKRTENHSSKIEASSCYLFQYIKSEFE